MLKVQIGTLEFQVETHARTTSTSLKVTGRTKADVRTTLDGTAILGGAQTDETKAALKAILAYIS